MAKETRGKKRRLCVYASESESTKHEARSRVGTKLALRRTRTRTRAVPVFFSIYESLQSKVSRDAKGN